MKETHEQLSKDLSEVQEIRRSLEEKLVKVEEQKQVKKLFIFLSCSSSRCNQFGSYDFHYKYRNFYWRTRKISSHLRHLTRSARSLLESWRS